MAAMGRRKIAVKNPLALSGMRTAIAVAPPSESLISGPIGTMTIASYGVELTVVGAPIMREGFITETGFLPSPSDTRKTILA